jgi:hypothetical protein
MFELERRTRARGQKLRLVASDDSPLRQALDLVHVRDSVAVDAELADAAGAFRPHHVLSPSSPAPA